MIVPKIRLKTLDEVFFPLPQVSEGERYVYARLIGSQGAEKSVTKFMAHVFYDGGRILVNSMGQVVEFDPPTYTCTFTVEIYDDPKCEVLMAVVRPDFLLGPHVGLHLLIVSD